jgi:ubiquinone/menaquinone biosynthesis C-methylase UbiE
MEPYQNIININDRVTKYGKIIVSILNKYTQKDLLRMDILDIGCGNGFFEFALSPYVHRIYGIDPSLPMLTSARQNNKHYKFKNIRFYKGSAENIPFTKTFDMIMFSHSLHYIKNIQKSLNKVLKNVNENGLILILEPTKTFSSKALDPTSPDFNKKRYNKKQKALQHAREQIKLFSSSHTILYQKHNEKKYWMLLQISH